MRLELRELYCPAHFGNSWQVMGRGERAGDLAEVKHWGFTRYGDWFDAIDCSDPYAEKRHYQLAHALWDRKRAAFQAAQAVGLETCLLSTPNHVFVDQVRGDIAAERGVERVFGQLICPSQPEARRIILDNHRNLLADLAACGVRLTAFAACPYDYGGCTCDACDPWILTFAALLRDIGAIAREYHPGIELHAVGWWWQRDEHEAFAAWADAEMPGQVRSLALHIPYGETAPAEVPLPRDCAVRAFIHNGYSDRRDGHDIYGKWGPVAAPRRIPTTLDGLAARDALGYMAYSEGSYEDVNRAILGALSSGLASSADEALQLYAERYFAADAATAAEWSNWWQALGEPFDADLPPLRRTFDRLAGEARPGWRLDQWAAKLRLLELAQAIGDGDAWPPARRQAADAWMAVTEDLQRRVWGVGPLTHIFGEKFLMPPWFEGYRREAGLPGATGEIAAEA